MMPRLNHKKAKTGCQRCKARKVKCDEKKPRCGACVRHNVSCEYCCTTAVLSDQPDSPSIDAMPSYVPYGTSTDLNDPFLDPRLELRLMHEWVAYTCESFSTAFEFWRYQAPLIALEFRFVLDSLLALAALHASRQGPAKWIPIEGRMAPLRHPQYRPSSANRDVTSHHQLRGSDDILANALSRSGNNAYLTNKRNAEMLAISRMYFDRAIDGHRKALLDLSVENVEAAYVCSILVSFNALFTLSESENDSTIPNLDPLQWLRLAKGTLFICAKWRQFVGDEWIMSSGVFYGLPNMFDGNELLHASHSAPFARLLTWGDDFETLQEEDRVAYSNSLSHIGLIYKSIVDGSDVPLATCRRLIALPSRCPQRFVELVEQHQPRALVMLAHIFAMMKLIADKAAWFRGIAERQIPKIHEQVPASWLEMMSWPMGVARGDIDPEPKETQIHDILSL